MCLISVGLKKVTAPWIYIFIHEIVKTKTTKVQCKQIFLYTISTVNEH